MLDVYERLADHSVEQIEFFEMAACLRRLVDISEPLSHGATSMGIRPEIETAMRQQVDYIQSVYSLLQERTGISLPKVEKMLTKLS